jgi:hypothetical protein
MDASQDLWGEVMREVVHAGDAAKLRRLISNPESEPLARGLWKESQDTTMLIEAVKTRQFECVKLLAPVSDAQDCDARGRTALMWAAATEQPKCLSELLAASDVDAECHKGKTALIYAAECGAEECLRLLLPLSKAAWSDEQGWTALTVAAANGNAGCVAQLVLADKDEENRAAALRWAIKGNMWEAADLLVERMPLDVAQKILKTAPKGALPRALALVENASLADALAPRRNVAVSDASDERLLSRRARQRPQSPRAAGRRL